MTTIIDSSELLRRAVQYILEEKSAGSRKTTADLVDDAAMRFNLSPIDSESLMRLLQDEKKWT